MPSAVLTATGERGENSMMKKIIAYVIGLTIAAGFFGSAAKAQSGSWSFVMQLPGDRKEIALGGPVFSVPDAQKQRYYVVDPKNSRLVSFDAQGKFLAAFDADRQLKRPVGMARDSRGNLWVAERAANEMVYIDLTARRVLSHPVSYADGGRVMVDRPAVDSADRLFVIDRLRGALLRLNDRMSVEQVYSGKGSDFKGFSDFKIKSDGIWALDGQARKIYHFSLDGALDAPIDLETDMEFPVSIELDLPGLIYVLDRHAGSVVVFDRRGKFHNRLFSKGNYPGRLWYPAHLAFDWKGRMCICDEGNNRFQIFGR